MARPLRLEAPGFYFHVLSRGNARQAIVLDDDDRWTFLRTLASTLARFEVACRSYCLMGNHYHLLLQPARANLSRTLRHLNGVYAQRLNRRHGRVGHVFQGRFTSLLVDHEAYLLELCRYIALNPVRAGFVASPEAWPWSSHRATAGLEPPPDFLRLDGVLQAFDLRGGAHAHAAYRSFVARALDDRDAGDEEFDRGGILGDETFVARFEEPIDAKSDALEIPRRERLLGRPDLSALLRRAATRSDRDALMREAFVVHGYTSGEIGAAAGVSRSTVSRALGSGLPSRHGMTQWET